jgi:hypothetical protein
VSPPVNAMLSDEDLTRLLGDAAESYEVPAEGPGHILEERGDLPARTPWLRRRGVQLAGVAAAVVVAAVVAQDVGGVAPFLKQDTTLADGGAVREPAGGLGVGGGTTGGGTTGGASGSTSTYTSANDAVSAPVPGSPSQLGSSGAGVDTGSVPAAVPQAQSPAKLAAGGLLSSVRQSAASLVDDGSAARVVKTGAISLVVDNGKVTPTVTKVTQVAKAVRGYVSDSSSQEFGDSPSAAITLRVPAASFDAAIAGIRALKAEVVTQESSGKDVTATYADTEAQIASLKAARSRFLTILSGARTIGETLTVQQRVDDVQGRIDRLEGQRRVLENQSDLATLTVTVGEKADAILKTSTPSGLSKAWDDAKDGFTSGVEGLVARSGRALLVLILAVVAVFVLRLGWRLARRRLV